MPTQPIQNLLDSVLALLAHKNNPVSALSDIVEQPTDEHGNILIGLDNPNFTLWRNKLEHFVPKKIFGPILIPTKQYIIGAILTDLKSGTEAKFKGNRSTDVVRGLVGGENIFASTDAATHSHHKGIFKNFLHDHEDNARRIAPLICQWTQTHCRSGRSIQDGALEILSAQIMLSFLLNAESVYNKTLVSDVINLKTHFVKKTTLKEVSFMRFFNGYNAAKDHLSAEIASLYGIENTYSHELAKSGQTLQQATSHILSLMMVGFDNLQSALMSLLLRLTEHPEYRTHLKNEMIKIDEIDFLHFDLSTVSASHENTFSQLFFMEALRLTPPVWLQARKNKNERLISYMNEAGNSVSFKLPSASLILIPNFQLARQLQNGHDFLPQREFEAQRLFNPFSTGPNACPGKNIAYAAAGVLIADMISREYDLTLLASPSLDPQVSLKWKNINIQAKDSKSIGTLSATSSIFESSNKYHKHFQKSCQLGLVVAMAVLLETHDILMAATSGATTTLFAMSCLMHAPATFVSPASRGMRRNISL